MGGRKKIKVKYSLSEEGKARTIQVQVSEDAGMREKGHHSATTEMESGKLQGIADGGAVTETIHDPKPTSENDDERQNLRTRKLDLLEGNGERLQILSSFQEREVSALSQVLVKMGPGNIASFSLKSDIRHENPYTQRKYDAFSLANNW